MLNKIVYIPENKTFEDDFNVTTATIIDMNIKSYKQKEIVKPLIPDKTVTYWGVVLTLQFETGSIADAIWKLDKTVTSECNDVPCIAIMKNKNKKKNKQKHKIKESVIPTILRSAGVNEWSELKGTKIRVKSICGWLMSVNGFCISPINENSGRWFYPHYFDFQNYIGSVNIPSAALLNRLKEIAPNITCEKDIADSDLRNIIIEKIVNDNRDLDGDIVNINGISYYANVMSGVIRTTEEANNDEYCSHSPINKFLQFIHDWMKMEGPYIAQEDQNRFKERFTEEYDIAFGREEENSGHDYGLIKMNKFLEKHNIGYKIKVVYATNTSPRHWFIVSRDGSNDPIK